MRIKRLMRYMQLLTSRCLTYDKLCGLEETIEKRTKSQRRGGEDKTKEPRSQGFDEGCFRRHKEAY